MHYGQFSNLNWLWWVAFVAIAIIVATLRHHRARAAFASPHLLSNMVSTNLAGMSVSLILSTLALVAIVVGLVDIRWGRIWREVPQRGIEVMFVLDVSRSMLAEDTSPNRLERSKRYIKDMIQEMAGDRVGLVLFAGDVKKHVPLTNHYGDFFSSLDEIGPHNIDRGGSNLGDAIEVAADAFLEKTSEHRAVVMFTDGEYHESEPVDAAKKALAENGTRIFTVGIGDSDAGARIPNQQQSRGQSERFLTHDGQAIMSRRNDGILEQIALATDGAYIPAGTKDVDMGAVYHQFIANIEQQDFESARVNIYVPRYQWFLGFALFLLVVDIFVSTAKRRPNPSLESESTTTSPTSVESVSRQPVASSAAVVCAVLMSWFSADTSFAQQSPNSGEQSEATATDRSPAELVQQGQAALKTGDMATAMERFRAAEERGFTDPRLSYNKGIAEYNAGDLNAARESFSQAAASSDRQLAGQARFNIGNSFYAEALQAAEQDPELAIANLQNAISHYRGALACSPKDEDARVNIELADRLKRQLKRQQEQQPENQQQQQQEQDQQENESQQNKEEDSEQQNQNEQSEDSKEDDRGENDDEKDGEQDQQSKSSSESESQESQESDNNDKEGESGQPGNEQPPKDGDLEAINETQQEPESSEGGKEGPPMTMQEARKLLQAVRDREFRNRIQEMRRTRPRRIAVEKDW